VLSGFREAGTSSAFGRRMLSGRRLLLVVGCLATTIGLAACLGPEEEAATSEAAHTSGSYTQDNSPFYWASEDYAQFRAGFGARQIFLAASTREGEEEQVLDALRELDPAVLAIIVPRHPQRFDSIAALLEQKSISYERRSSERAPSAQTRVWLGDSMGEMYAYYAACDVAFVGGSLVPLGGQNLLEACALGKPVLVGAHTYNFAEATQLALDAGAALRVQDAQSLGRAVNELLLDRIRRETMGRAGRELMGQHQGAAQRIVHMIEHLSGSTIEQDTNRPGA